jgi:hypothetical protein
MLRILTSIVFAVSSMNGLGQQPGRPQAAQEANQDFKAFADVLRMRWPDSPEERGRKAALMYFIADYRETQAARKALQSTVSAPGQTSEAQNNFIQLQTRVNKLKEWEREPDRLLKDWNRAHDRYQDSIRAATNSKDIGEGNRRYFFALDTAKDAVAFVSPGGALAVGGGSWLTQRYLEDLLGPDNQVLAQKKLARYSESDFNFGFEKQVYEAAMADSFLRDNLINPFLKSVAKVAVGQSAAEIVANNYELADKYLAETEKLKSTTRDKEMLERLTRIEVLLRRSKQAASQHAAALKANRAPAVDAAEREQILSELLEAGEERVKVAIRYPSPPPEFIARLEREAWSTAGGTIASLLSAAGAGHEVRQVEGVIHATSQAASSFEQAHILSGAGRYIESGLMSGSGVINLFMQLADLGEGATAQKLDQIYDTVRDIQETLKQTRHEMHQRFNHIDQSLGYIIDRMETEFRESRRLQASTIQKANEILQRTTGVSAQLEELPLLIDAYFERANEEDKGVARMCLNYERHFKTKISQEYFEKCLALFHDCAVNAQPLRSDGLTPVLAMTRLKRSLERGSVDDLGFLLDMASQASHLNLTPSRETGLNASQWSVCATQYMAFAIQYPDLYQRSLKTAPDTNIPYQLSELSETGQAIEASLLSARTALRSNVGAKGPADARGIEKTFVEYAASLKSFGKAATAHREFIQSGPLPLSKMSFPLEQRNSFGFDRYDPLRETDSKYIIRQHPLPKKIGYCSSLRPFSNDVANNWEVSRSLNEGFSTPTGMDRVIPLSVRIAEAQGLGKLELCVAEISIGLKHDNVTAVILGIWRTPKGDESLAFKKHYSTPLTDPKFAFGPWWQKRKQNTNEAEYYKQGSNGLNLHSQQYSIRDYHAFLWDQIISPRFAKDGAEFGQGEHPQLYDQIDKSVQDYQAKLKQRPGPNTDIDQNLALISERKKLYNLPPLDGPALFGATQSRLGAARAEVAHTVANAIHSGELNDEARHLGDRLADHQNLLNLGWKEAMAKSAPLTSLFRGSQPLLSAQTVAAPYLKLQRLSSDPVMTAPIESFLNDHSLAAGPTLASVKNLVSDLDKPGLHRVSSPDSPAFFVDPITNTKFRWYGPEGKAIRERLLKLKGELEALKNPDSSENEQVKRLLGRINLELEDMATTDWLQQNEALIQSALANREFFALIGFGESAEDVFKDKLSLAKKNGFISYDQLVVLQLALLHSTFLENIRLDESPALYQIEDTQALIELFKQAAASGKLGEYRAAEKIDALPVAVPEPSTHNERPRR